MNLPKLAADKANHHVYGSYCAVVARLLAHALPQYAIPPSAAAMAGATIAGAVKEGIDAALNYLAVRRGEIVPHTVDLYDFLATAAGGIPVALVVL